MMCKILVKIGPVVSAENRLQMEIALRVHVVRHILSNISVYTDRFSQSFYHMKALYGQIMDRYLIFRFLKGRCHGNQIICERQVRHGQKSGIFCQIFPDILDRFSQSFHHVKAFYVRMMDLYLFSKFGELPSSNLGFYAVKTRNFCRHAPAIEGDLHTSRWRFEMDWKIAILISAE